MKVSLLAAALLTSSTFLPAATGQQAGPASNYGIDSDDTTLVSSTYLPMDSWVYPALDRLRALGYLDTAFLGLRPWTRQSIAHMLERDEDRIEAGGTNDEARELYFAVRREIQPGSSYRAGSGQLYTKLESVYSTFRGISGTSLRDSFHLGQTETNDYGRPYEPGFNNYSGFSGYIEAGKLSFYYRGEYQYSPSGTGYPTALASYLSNEIDDIPFAQNPVQDTLPTGPIQTVKSARLMEGYLSYRLAGHAISIGKNDHWLGPAQGASMLWGNNAENIYGFEINRVEPLHIPLVSRLLGPFRYDFFVGSLKGHTSPNDPWAHVEKISFKPTRNLEVGFDRLVIWGGKGHEPVTLHTFLRSFFSFQNVSGSEKFSAQDPGARFGTFDFNYRLPFLREWVILYSDSLVHDDVSPISAPRRSGIRPGIYLARFPGLEQLDLRVEGVNTDTPSASNQKGQFLYWETVQKQGPTNKGTLVGDWIGRQGKGGQGWITYHLSPREEVQFEYRRAKAASAFIPGGTTQDDFLVHVRKRLKKDIEILGVMQYEHWKAPIYKTDPQNNLSTTVQITWFPH